MDWRERIIVDPEICHGKAHVRGTRVPVSVILDNLAAGESSESLATGYHVAIEDVRAVLQSGARGD
jgi:uncharacterized protein (DUF433 family)